MSLSWEDVCGAGQWWGRAAPCHGEGVPPRLEASKEKSQAQLVVREDQVGCSRGFGTDFPHGLSWSMGNWHFGCSERRPGQPRTGPRCFPLASALCRPHTQGWMMVPTAASSTPAIAAGTGDGALLCVAAGPKGFTQENTTQCGTAMELAPLISISPAAAPHSAKGRSPVSSLPPRSGEQLHF